MFARVEFPESIQPEELDHYLEQGWFRMGQTIFTTNFLSFKDHFYSAVWLRIDLSRYTIDKTQRTLMKRNASFRTAFRNAEISPIKEALYAKYREAISFEASPSLNQLLLRHADRSIYNTHEVNIYDGENLIATGFFDIGKQSSAGITSVYDPAYRKYSLGKYLIYLKINYCINQGMKYFYPGYFVPGYPLFDYKLSIGTTALEYLDYASQQWLPISNFSPDHTPIQVMRNRLFELQQFLAASRIESKVTGYAYFDASLIPELKDADTLDYPLFLHITDVTQNNDYQMIVVYDIDDRCYHLIKCSSLWRSPATTENNGIYSSNLLKIQDDLFSAEIPQLLISRLL